MTAIAHKTLRDVCSLIIDCEHKTAPIQETGYPSIRTPNIGRGRLILEPVNRVSEEIYIAWTKRATPQAGDLILAREAPAGNIAIIPRNLKVCLGQRTVLLRPDKKQVDPSYLLYLLLEDNMQAKFLSYGSGATVPHVNMSDIRALQLPMLPPLPIQRRIASILSAYDDLIENNTRRIAILEEMARRIYEEWFVKFKFPGHEKVKIVDSELGKIPEGWKVVAFTDLAEVLSGGTPRTTIDEYWNGDIPFFAPKDAPQAFYVTVTEKKITSLGLSKCNSKLYPKDTVFITARGTVGKVVMPSTDMAMNQSCYALRGREGINQLYLFLTTFNSVEYLKKNTGGATFDTIVIDTFRLMKVIKPALELLVSFEKTISPLFSLILNLIQRNTNLRTTRDFLLPKLISGEIDVSSLAEPEEAAA